jgi:hypothetical protein
MEIDECKMKEVPYHRGFEGHSPLIKNYKWSLITSCTHVHVCFVFFVKHIVLINF